MWRRRAFRHHNLLALRNIYLTILAFGPNKLIHLVSDIVHGSSLQIIQPPPVILWILARLFASKNRFLGLPKEKLVTLPLCKIWGKELCPKSMGESENTSTFLICREWLVQNTTTQVCTFRNEDTLRLGGIYVDIDGLTYQMACRVSSLN